MAHDADKKTIIKKILKPFSRLFATHFMANGEACGKWQFGEKLFRGGRVKIFKTIINTSKNRYDPAMREKTRAEYGFGDKLVLGHIGRLTEQKNTLFIIDIFAEVLKIEPEAILLIIGEGNLREEMIKKVSESGLSESVLYLGRREDIHQFYNAMDSFLLPSLYEGLPVVGVEAETHGLPVFFSTEISRESSPCDDLGIFTGLDTSAAEWAKKIVSVTKSNISKRKDRSSNVLQAGFDSVMEAEKLAQYYEELLAGV
ncbi:MAG: glycosyltransferase [Clostridiales bacterium]|nr:glycosyltransferase [Clostridiales bacterium]